MGDIDVQPEGIRVAFARNEAVKIDISGVNPFLTTSQCLKSVDLPGCLAFEEADQNATAVVKQTLTRADYLIKGLRQGAERQADIYDRTEEQVDATIASLAPREDGLPPVNAHLELAQQLNEPYQEPTAPTGPPPSSLGR